MAGRKRDVQEKDYTIAQIKDLGKIQTAGNLSLLIRLYEADLGKNEMPVDMKREVVSSIGRHMDLDKVYKFIKKHMFDKQPLDVMYQMFRTLLYKAGDDPDSRFMKLAWDMMEYYSNTTMNRMELYHRMKKIMAGRKIPYHVKGTIPGGCKVIHGDSSVLLHEFDVLPPNCVHLVFTSPPCYNTREYMNCKNYEEYLDTMYKVFDGCRRVLENGRFMIVNVSPVIERRPGREFESRRFPIHYDFHQLLQKAGFMFVDEIYWIKPEESVPNRIGRYPQTRRPLGYRPNCVTESLMVYRKDSGFPIDNIIKEYPEYDRHEDEEVDTTNCWCIPPKADKEHPAVLPEELCRKVLKYYSYEGDVVLDPFAGSGTVGTTALKMGRQAVLIEKEGM